jgi:hypothetical protein
LSCFSHLLETSCAREFFAVRMPNVRLECDVPADEKLSRGLARQAERVILGSSDEARRQSFDFAMDLLRRNSSGRKIDAPSFNVPLARIAKSSETNAATIHLEARRLGVTKTGLYHRQSLKAEDVRHLRDEQKIFVAREWAVAMDQIGVQRGGMSAAFWTAPVFFGNHIVTRYLQRNRAAGGERIIELVTSGLPLAVLARECALTTDRSRFHAWDIVLPAPGGVLCGGTELVDCSALAYKFVLGHRAAGWGLDAVTEASSLHMVISIRTYLADETLSAGQTAVVTDLRRWCAAHDGALWDAWRSGAPMEEQTALIESFRPYCLDVQEHFSSWRRELRQGGYYDLDFEGIAKACRIPEWVSRSVGTELLSRHMRVPLNRR